MEGFIILLILITFLVKYLLLLSAINVLKKNERGHHLPMVAGFIFLTADILFIVALGTAKGWDGIGIGVAWFGVHFFCFLFTILVRLNAGTHQPVKRKIPESHQQVSKVAAKPLHQKATVARPDIRDLSEKEIDTFFNS